MTDIRRLKVYWLHRGSTLLAAAGLVSLGAAAELFRRMRQP